MKWPNFLKFKLPEWNFNFKPTGLFKSTDPLSSAWKSFMRQIPPDSKAVLKSYQHFLILGSEKSGKTDLIQGFIDQSQDLYSFDTTYSAIPDVQFYVGPRHIFQELSFSTLENRSIKSRKQIIRLWKRLYARHEPIVVVTLDCDTLRQGDLKELNKIAQLIAGKISLLSEIVKGTIKLRIALTHVDKVSGYLEFARYLKQQNATFSIDVSTNFDSGALSNELKRFSEEHLSLLLTSTSHSNFDKIVQFFKEMPQLLPTVEEFLRSIVSRIPIKESIQLETVSFTSSHEGSSALGLFQWSNLHSAALFFRHPMLKHQVAAGLVFVVSAALLMNSYIQSRNELLYVQKGIELLDLLQFPTFREQIVANHSIITNQSSTILDLVSPHFFNRKLALSKDRLASRIRKHLMEPEFHRTILENKGEFKYLYFLGLMQATSNNNLGKFISKNAAFWAKALGVDENLIKIYIASCSKPVMPSRMSESKASPFIPLTSLDPWLSFLQKFKEATDQAVLVDQPFEGDELINDTDKLITAIGRLRNDPLVFGITTLLDETGLSNNENIKTIQWIGENIDALENFLLFVKQTSVPSLNIQDMNLSQFFAKLKEIANITNLDNELYNFSLMDHLFSFDSKKWTNHIVTYNIERALQDYIAVNTDSNGAIFFNNTLETLEPAVSHFQELYPMKTKVSISGRFSRGDYEKKVRSPAEKVVSFIDSLPINPEEKKRFSNFLTREAIGYIKSYQSKYIKFFDSYDVQTDSMKGVKTLLAGLSTPSSDFYEFLRTVHYQTSVFSEPILALKNPDALNDFAFLDTILIGKEDGPPPIAEYQGLIGELLQALEAAKPASMDPGYLSISSGLSPAAVVSLDIFQNKPDSFLVRLHECIKKMGVPDRFQAPFLKPLLLVHKLGLGELKISIEKIWSQQFQPKLDDVLRKFPFDPTETTFASFQEVDALLNPSSEFYITMKNLLSLCSFQKEGRWRPINPELMKLDDALYAKADRVLAISETLWTAEGLPKPIQLKMSSVPFKIEGEQAIPVLSYIVVGGESMYNFNQDPSWQPMQIEWWKPDASYVGVELLNKMTNSKSYRNIQGTATPWSFYSLLKQASLLDGNIWSWDLPAKDGKNTQMISLKFETNPYDVFNTKVIP